MPRTPRTEDQNERARLKRLVERAGHLAIRGRALSEGLRRHDRQAAVYLMNLARQAARLLHQIPAAQVPTLRLPVGPNDARDTQLHVLRHTRQEIGGEAVMRFLVLAGDGRMRICSTALSNPRTRLWIDYDPSQPTPDFDFDETADALATLLDSLEQVLAAAEARLAERMANLERRRRERLAASRQFAAPALLSAASAAGESSGVAAPMTTAAAAAPAATAAAALLSAASAAGESSGVATPMTTAAAASLSAASAAGESSGVATPMSAAAAEAALPSAASADSPDDAELLLPTISDIVESAVSESVPPSSLPFIDDDDVDDEEAFDETGESEASPAGVPTPPARSPASSGWPEPADAGVTRRRGFRLSRLGKTI